MDSAPPRSPRRRATLSAVALVGAIFFCTTLTAPATAQLVGPRQYFNALARDLVYTRDVGPCTNYAVSQNRKCGPENGFTKCPDGQCCSKYGWCSGPDATGPVEDYCAQERGCLLGFGVCYGTGTPYCIKDINSMSQSCPNYPVSSSRRCGKLFGFTKCPEGECCSRWNYCSGPDAPDPKFQYCDINLGCQLGYGNCYDNQGVYCRVNLDLNQEPTWSYLPPTGTATKPITTTTTTTTTTTKTQDIVEPTTTTVGPTIATTAHASTHASSAAPTIPISLSTTIKPTGSGKTITATFTAEPFYNLTKDGTCGQTWNDTRCPDDICCSAKGACQDDGGNNGEAWCGAGCQIGFGKCWAGVVVVGQRCGPEFGGASCPENICCSSDGYCQDDGGTWGDRWCGCGCQDGFGVCLGLTPEECSSKSTGSVSRSGQTAATSGGQNIETLTPTMSIETLTPTLTESIPLTETLAPSASVSASLTPSAAATTAHTSSHVATTTGLARLRAGLANSKAVKLGQLRLRD